MHEIHVRIDLKGILLIEVGAPKHMFWVSYLKKQSKAYTNTSALTPIGGLLVGLRFCQQSRTPVTQLLPNWNNGLLL